MAEIYEQRGERRQAAPHYTRFTELWLDADPQLRPLVQDVRQRLRRFDPLRPPEISTQ
jgi:hypothetical protein